MTVWSWLELLLSMLLYAFEPGWQCELVREEWDHAANQHTIMAPYCYRYTYEGCLEQHIGVYHSERIDPWVVP